MLFTVGVPTNLTTAGSGLVTRRGMGPQRGVDSAPAAGGAAASSGAGPRADRVPSLYIGEAEDYTGASGVYNQCTVAPVPSPRPPCVTIVSPRIWVMITITDHTGQLIWSHGALLHGAGQFLAARAAQ